MTNNVAIHYVQGESFTVAKGGEHYCITKDNPLFDSLVVHYRKHGACDDLLKMASKKGRLVNHTSGLFSVDEDNNVYVDGLAVPKSLADKIWSFVNDSLPFEAFINFFKRLKNNPSSDSIQNLFGFLEHNHVPLTPDGCFIAYRAVARNKKGELWDIYTFNSETDEGTHRNDVGCIVEMDRDLVNPDRNTTCAPGLHAASFHYAQNMYGSWNGNKRFDVVMIQTKIDPADVVCVPTDYNNAKMRICRYEVLDVCHEEYKGNLFNDVDENEDHNYGEYDDGYADYDDNGPISDDYFVDIRTDLCVSIPREMYYNLIEKGYAYFNVSNNSDSITLTFGKLMGNYKLHPHSKVNIYNQGEYGHKLCLRCSTVHIQLLDNNGEVTATIKEYTP